MSRDGRRERPHEGFSAVGFDSEIHPQQFICTVEEELINVFTAHWNNNYFFWPQSRFLQTKVKLVQANVLCEASGEG